MGLLAVLLVGACDDQAGESSKTGGGDAGSPASSGSSGADTGAPAEGGSAAILEPSGGAAGQAMLPAGGLPLPISIEVPVAPSNARPVNVLLGASASAQSASHRIGIGIHNYAPNSSNTSLYLERLGVNATRVFGAYLVSTTLPKYFGNGFGRDLDGNLVQTHSAFNAACKALSGGPEAPDWKNAVLWADIRARMGSAGVGLLPTIDEQVRLGLDLDLQLSPPSSFDFSTYDDTTAQYWQERWSLYVYYYAEARILLQHGVRTFELINEPDLIDYTVERLHDLTGIASRAVQTAAADLNAKVLVLGPTFGRNGADLDHSEYAAFLAALHERFAAGPSAKWSNVQALAFHRYSGDGTLFSDIATTLADYAAAHTDVKLPLWITEFNAYTGAAWDQRSDSPDTAAAASRFLAEAVALSDKVDGQIAFLMGMYGSPAKVQKNGIHWIDNSGSSAGNIGGRTRSAAAFGLFARTFAGGAPLWQLNLTGAAAGQLAIATAGAERVAILLVNDAPTVMDARIDFSALDLNQDAVAAWQVVDGEHRGETVVRYALGEAQALSRSVPANGVVLVTVPRGAGPFSHFRYPVVAAAELRAASLQDEPQGEHGTLRIQTDPAGDNAQTSVALLSFAPGSGDEPVESDAIAQAILQLRIEQAGGRECVIHAFAVPTADWSASDVTWQSSGLLQPLADGAAVDAISKNFVAHDSKGLSFLGDLDVAPAIAHGDSLQLDVTDFARAHATGFTVLLVREFMNDGTTDNNPAPDDLNDSWVTIHGAVDSDDLEQPGLLIEAR